MFLSCKLFNCPRSISPHSFTVSDITENKLHIEQENIAILQNDFYHENILNQMFLFFSIDF